MMHLNSEFAGKAISHNANRESAIPNHNIINFYENGRQKQ